MLGLTSCLYTVEETAVTNDITYTDAAQPPYNNVSASEMEPFVVLISQLTEIGYYLQKQNCNYPTENGSYCLIPPAENAISKAIDAVNNDFDSGNLSIQPEIELAPINMGGLLEIKSCALRADYKIQENNFPRATVEEWTFDEDLSAEKVAIQLKQLSHEEWYYLTESQISWWRKNNKLYFIFPAGNFMLTDIPKLQQKLQESM
ncbi:hypothetical protein D770_01585 [Flammeovirgaceae bacterium 311]|nr:hypothetical protein D770_01585 [Flammeovirgaceae bacterium 311]